MACGGRPARKRFVEDGVEGGAAVLTLMLAGYVAMTGGVLSLGLITLFLFGAGVGGLVVILGLSVPEPTQDVPVGYPLQFWDSKKPEASVFVVVLFTALIFFGIFQPQQQSNPEGWGCRCLANTTAYWPMFSVLMLTVIIFFVLVGLIRARDRHPELRRAPYFAWLGVCLLPVLAIAFALSDLYSPLNTWGLLLEYPALVFAVPFLTGLTILWITRPRIGSKGS